MLDFSKLKTKKGSKIEAHFENEEAKLNFKKMSAKDDKGLMKDINSIDPGKGTIHLIINQQGIIKGMSEKEFLDWQKDPESERNWFHIEDIILDLNEIFSLLSFIGLFPGLYVNNFTGATPEEYDNLPATPEMEQYLRSIRSAKKCECCPEQSCLTRRASFSITKLDEYIAEQ